MASSSAVSGERLRANRSRSCGSISPFSVASAVVSAAIVFALVTFGHRSVQIESSDPPTIRASAIPFSVRPENPGGQITDFVGYSVNRIISGQKSKEIGETIVIASPLTDLEPDDLSLRDARLSRSRLVGALDSMDGSHNATGSGQIYNLENIEAKILSLSLAASDQERETRMYSSLEVFPGSYFAHLGDFPTRQKAEADWLDLLGSYGGSLQPHSIFIQELQVDDEAVFRLRISGFKDRVDVNEFCERLQAEGNACLPAAA